MPTPNEKLAESLDVLEALQQGNQRVFRSDDLSRVHRERLVENGFLQEVMKGWLISSRPDTEAGESTPWHASFWEFCARYCDERFGEQWHLSPEQSVLLHGERTVIPDQLVVHSPKGMNNDIKLLFGTTLYDLKVAEMPATAAFWTSSNAGRDWRTTFCSRPRPATSCPAMSLAWSRDEKAGSHGLIRPVFASKSPEATMTCARVWSRRV